MKFISQKLLLSVWSLIMALLMLMPGKILSRFLNPTRLLHIDTALFARQP